jgi:hypothetical protein
LRSARIADAVRGRALPIPEPVAARATYAARIQPSEAGWLDMATMSPIMDTSHARELLDWRHTMASTDALTEVLDGIGDDAGFPTPALRPR